MMEVQKCQPLINNITTSAYEASTPTINANHRHPRRRIGPGKEQ
jgi:hypothetical protein